MSRERFLETASSIGHRLVRDAIWSGDRCNWLGDSMELVLGDWKVAHRSFGPELYAGTAGIALFLHRLHAVTNEALLLATAKGAIAQSLSRIDDLPPSSRPTFYPGWAGIAWTLIEMGDVDRGLELLERAGDESDLLDVVTGVAGSIAPLLRLHKRFGHAWLLDRAIAHGRTLVRTANRSAEGASWTTSPGYAARDLTGYSHGTAGIAVALLELSAATNDASLRALAEDAFRYERAHFSEAQQNWPDFRVMPGTPQDANWPGYAMAWCHGAPGIALSRLRAYELTGDDTYRLEAGVAIQTTYRAVSAADPTGANFSLCHGTSGNTEAFVVASRVLREPGYLAVADWVADRGIELYARPTSEWPCGVNGGGETPNLMIGTAGIGHFYLRLFDPDRVPSVLLM